MKRKTDRPGSTGGFTVERISGLKVTQVREVTDLSFVTRAVPDASKRTWNSESIFTSPALR